MARTSLFVWMKERNLIWDCLRQKRRQPDNPGGSQSTTGEPVHGLRDSLDLLPYRGKWEKVVAKARTPPCLATCRAISERKWRLLKVKQSLLSQKLFEHNIKDDDQGCACKRECSEKKRENIKHKLFCRRRVLRWGGFPYPTQYRCTYVWSKKVVVIDSFWSKMG